MNAVDPKPNDHAATSFVPAVAAALVPPPNASAHTRQVIMVVGYGLMSFFCLLLIAHLLYNRSDALKGNSSAARRIILPAFEPLLWILGATTAAFTITLFLLLVLKVFETGTPKIATECFYSGRQFVFLLVMVFMHQKSVSIPALCRCVVISLVLATYTIPFVIYTTYWGDAAHTDTYYQIQRVLRLGLVAWYVYIFVRPPSRASKKSIREFCGFTFVYQAFSLSSTELVHAGFVDTATMLTNCMLLWSALCPLVIWRVLRADTEHWRGMGKRVCALQTIFHQRNQIHEHVSSEGLHVLIEMHRKLLIDFAYLELCNKIGVGSSAVVYNGVLHSRTPVAAKVYTPLVLTVEVVASFSQEAAFCGALKHPNIVTFHGLCVCPPTICLVFELCQGSLESVLRNQRRPKPLALNHQTQSIQVGYMVDAARAVAYLHSFSPSFLHRDIKPANFLVDSEHNVKLSDFGESRSVVTPLDARESIHSREKRDDELYAPEIDGGIVLPPTVLEMRETAQYMTVKGTVEYMAPELISGKGGFACYGEAADVYSLAMTMWDILHPGEERYPGCSSNHLHVFEAVLDGKRPTVGSHVHAMVRDVIISSWHVDPRRRPSAQFIVDMLEGIQEEVSAAFLLDGFQNFGLDSVALLVADEDEEQPQYSVSNGGSGKQGKRGRGRAATRSISTAESFSGADAVGHLMRNQYATSVGEALRLGRMWLDAGFLHHYKHAQGFTNDDAQFYLDEEYIRMCQQIGGCGGDGGGREGPHFEGSRSVGPSHPRRSGGRRSNATSVGGRGPLKSEANVSTLAGRRAMCACRKHGQRQLHDVKPGRRPRFKRKKIQSINETNVLTTSLLTPDDIVTSGGSSSEPSGAFAEFDWHGSDSFGPVRQ